MRILVIDTCLGACQVALAADGVVVAGLSEAMQRGHQERLAPMAREVMAAAGAGFDDLGRIAVTVGPGSFTGLRVGLAFAKGLGLATGLPLAGLGTLAGIAASGGPGALTAGVIDARRGQVYLQPFDAGRPLAEPAVLPADEAAAKLRALAQGGWRLIGPGAGLLAGCGEVVELAVPTLPALARLAAAAPTSADVRPLYLRAPDARPMAS